MKNTPTYQPSKREIAAAAAVFIGLWIMMNFALAALLYLAGAGLTYKLATRRTPGYYFPMTGRALATAIAFWPDDFYSEVKARLTLPKQ